MATGGWVNAFYIQDQIKATKRLTVNVGFRNDMVYTPIYGTGNGGNYYTGEANPLTGQYILNALPPNCSVTQGAPCIPTGIYTASNTPAPGGLPAHTIVSPTRRMIKNSLADWGPRLGLAYRLNDKTTIRGGYGREYDEWATIVQLSQNFGGNWPAVNTIDNNGLNTNIPTVSVADPLQLGSGGAIVYPINDFSQVSQWMVDPNFRTPYTDQWNVGIERELPGNIALDANYVGSNGRHEDWGPTMNTPQPGPGDVQARRPYPYMQEQWFDQSVGDSRYNALQVTVNKRPTHGVSFRLLTRCHIRTPTAATWVQAATRQIHTIAPATTALQTSTRRTRFRRHSRCSHHSQGLPISWSPVWLVDGPSTALCNLVRGRLTP